MSRVLKNINKHIEEAKPSHYDNVSYNKCLTVLTNISNEYIEEKESLKAEILRIADDDIRLKLLELI